MTSARDNAKRAVLNDVGGSVASEWYVLDVTKIPTTSAFE